jgi:hypothetical protein
MSEALQAAADASGVSTGPGRSYLDSPGGVTNDRRNHRTGRRSATPYTDILGLISHPEGATSAGVSRPVVKDRPRSLVKSRGRLVRKKRRRETATSPRRMLHGRLCVCVPRRRPRWVTARTQRPKPQEGGVCPPPHTPSFGWPVGCAPLYSTLYCNSMVTFRGVNVTDCNIRGGSDE